MFSELLNSPTTENVDPNTPDSERSCLDSVHAFEVTAHALIEFTADYVAQIRECNAVHMLVTQAKIGRDHNGETASGFGEKSIDDMALFVQRLYKASSASTADAPKALEDLQKLLNVVMEIANNLEGRQSDVQLQRLVERVWNTAFSCMSTIEGAHQEMLSKPGMRLFKERLANEVAETERLMWYDWLRDMRESVFEEGGTMNICPLMQEFSWSSLLWYHEKISEAMRRLD